MKEIKGIDYRLIRRQNGGSGQARNSGLETLVAGWVFFLDSDDELAFDPIPFVNRSAGKSSLAFSVRFRKNGKPCGKLRPVVLGPRNFIDVFTACNAYHPSSIIFRRECLDSLFDPSFLYLEDWLFWIQNPRIFADMKIFPDIVSAIIHSHGGNKTASYILHGAYRQKVAEKVHLEFSSRLTRKQKNNLMVQARIGMLQQGLRIPLGAFLFLPCDPLLYLKLFVYYAWKGRYTGFSLYGDRK